MGQFQATIEAFTTLVFAVRFRKIALNSDFRKIRGFIHAGAGEDNSKGVNFQHHRKLLSP